MNITDPKPSREPPDATQVFAGFSFELFIVGIVHFLQITWMQWGDKLYDIKIQITSRTGEERVSRNCRDVIQRRAKNVRLGDAPEKPSDRIDHPCLQQECDRRHIGEKRSDPVQH